MKSKWMKTLNTKKRKVQQEKEEKQETKKQLKCFSKKQLFSCLSSKNGRKLKLRGRRGDVSVETPLCQVPARLFLRL